MTKKIILPLLAIILLSSCASKFGLQKRRYNKGFYVSVNKHKQTVKKDGETPVVASAKHNGAKAQQSEARINIPVELSQPEVISFVNHAVAATKHEATNSTHPAKHVSVLTASAKAKSIFQSKEFKHVIAAQKISKSGKGDSDANLILLVILSLFPILALIAMYIHDGHKITTNFWVDLILHLTIIGYIIFALLVVFDVVDLS